MTFTAEKLKYICHMRGRIGWQNLRSDEFTDEGPYLVTGMHFSNGSVDWNKCYHVSEERYATDANIHVESGDLLITKDGSIGKLAYIDSLPGPACLNSHLLLIRPKNGHISTIFLYYLLQSEEFQRFILEQQSGTTFYGISQESIENFKARFPESVFDQVAIAEHIKQQTSRIDTLIGKKQRLIELLEEKRRALITRAVTKGIDPSAPIRDSEVTWLADVPAHWTIAPLYTRYDVQLGKMLDTRQVTGLHLAPYLRNVDVQWDRVLTENLPEMDFDPDDRKRFALRKGDLLVCEGGEVGRAAVWNGDLGECYYQKALHRLRPREHHRDLPKFLMYLLRAAAQSGVFVAGSNQNTIDHLTAEKLRRHRFSFPPAQEQRAIVEYLDGIGGLRDPLISSLEATISLLREYRSALITAAVTGQLDIRQHEKKMEALA